MLTISSVVRMLHYTFTISLGFPHFAALFIGLAGVIFFIVRYRVSLLGHESAGS